MLRYWGWWLVALVGCRATNPEFAAQAGSDGATSAAASTTTGMATTAAQTGNTAGCDQVWYPDGDGDGFGNAGADAVGGCTQPPGHEPNNDDCDDDEPGVNPQALEICDAIDNDCNGANNDDPALPCAGCEGIVESGQLFLLCPGQIDWDEADADCVDRGYDLASIHDAEANEAIRAFAANLQLQWVWLGLNDRQVEGDFVWTDGSPFDYDNWNTFDGEPNNEFDQDCAALGAATGFWHDRDCIHDGGLPEFIPTAYLCASS